MKRCEFFTDIDLKIDAENIKRNVNATLNAEPSERKMYMKHKIFKTTALAAAITALLATSAFAMSPAGQEFIGNIISYFNNEQAVELTDIKELAKYNEAIGASDSKNGFTFTLDNVAADDNFVHIFYTIRSEEKFVENPDDEIVTGPMIWTDVIINGKLAGWNNHNEWEGYFEDCYTLKVAQKLNVSTQDVPDNIHLEIVSAPMLPECEEWGFDISRFYSNDTDEPQTLTEEEKSKLLYVCADIDKSDVKVNTVTKKLNLHLPWTQSTRIEKVIFSPFGNQLVVTTDATGDPDIALREQDSFALFDENGTALDILNTDLGANLDGSSRNSFEFLKADANTKQLKFVPVMYVRNEGDECVEPIKQKIGAYPLEYKLSDDGKVVVTDIRISDGKIEIDYYKDGFVMYDPGFSLMNDNGDNAEPGGKLGCVLYTRVHHDTSSYTAEYVYENYDGNGDPIPADESVSAENLRKNFTTLGVYTEPYFKLDFDRAVTVDLK